MAFWKVLGGVAAGVGAVVALPVAGPIGAVTLAGAAVGAGIGGLAGAAAAAHDKSQKRKARQLGAEEERAKNASKVERLVRALEEAEQRMNEDRAYFDLLIAMYAVGVAVAACDGSIADEERRDIREFVAGVGSSELPEHVKERIAALEANPPDFATAMALVERVDRRSWDLFDDVIDLVAGSDGVLCAKEAAFREAWRLHKAA
jgi:uncharacterized membrane protein YebE (DUF533 family)